MRRLMFLAAILVPSLAAPCSLVNRKAGQHMVAPAVLFEGRVIEAHATELPFTSTRKAAATSVVVEITRSYHGPFEPGTRVKGKRFDVAGLCSSGPVVVGDRVIVWSDDALAPFDVGVLYDDAPIWDPLAKLAMLNEPLQPLAETRGSVGVRGSLLPREAKSLWDRAAARAAEPCEIRRANEFAMVACGNAFHGRDARLKVVYEKVMRNWVEVLRYELTAETEAELEKDASRAVASAGSTS